MVIKIQGGKVESDVHYEYSLDGGKTWEKVDGDTIRFKEEGKKEIIVIAINETGLKSEPTEKFSFTIEKSGNNNGDNNGGNNNGGNNNGGNNNGGNNNGNNNNGGNNGNNNGNSNNNHIFLGDNTTANGKIPQTGIQTVMISLIIVILGIAIYSFIKLRKIKKEE